MPAKKLGTENMYKQQKMAELYSWYESSPATLENKTGAMWPQAGHTIQNCQDYWVTLYTVIDNKQCTVCTLSHKILVKDILNPSN